MEDTASAKIVEVFTVSKPSPELTEAVTIFNTEAKTTEVVSVFKIAPKIIHGIFFCVGLSFFATFAYLRYLPYLFQIQELWEPFFAPEFVFAQMTVLAVIGVCIFYKSCAMWGALVLTLLVILFVFKSGMDDMYGVLKSHPKELLPLSAQPKCIQLMVQSMETQNHCCGVFDSLDWGKHVPESCFCKQNVSNCKDVNGQMVFSASCEPHVAALLEDFAANAHHMFCVFVTDSVLGVILILYLGWQVYKHPEQLDGS